jgi:hypothetical protein
LIVELIDFKTRRVAAIKKNLVELCELELKHSNVKNTFDGVHPNQKINMTFLTISDTSSAVEGQHLGLEGGTVTTLLADLNNHLFHFSVESNENHFLLCVDSFLRSAGGLCPVSYCFGTELIALRR